ncbi:MAG: DGQHR domain-containing protein [Proteobacteria bacterium]|nr:DGQHR domain-containing protein [Pseudomonadota bacterium]
MPTTIKVPGFQLQADPQIVVCGIKGRWLLTHATPSWRIRDPLKGFQRVVKEPRARSIAISVLDQGRTFPNAIVLATDAVQLSVSNGIATLPDKSRFLVVDGQHRLWAQNFADEEATYTCVIHLGLTEVQMARLFLEINDNQKRVPPSLRWDLVRLVRADDDPAAIEAADLVFELATDQSSPLFQRIDLTGEQGKIELKQASLAPEIKSLIGSRGPLHGLDFEAKYAFLYNFFGALRNHDPDAWRSADTPLIKARVLRALFRVLPSILSKSRLAPDSITESDFLKYIKRINVGSLGSDEIRAIQGSAGISEIASMLRTQMKLS